MGRVTSRHSVVRVSTDGPDKPPTSLRRIDTVAVEEPLEVRVNGTAFSVTMRTPGDDIDLVHGLLHSEQIIGEVQDLQTARYCDGAGPDGLNTYNVLDLQLAAGVAAPDPGLTRNVLTSSACGVCGTTTIDQVVRGSRFPLDPANGPVVPVAAILSAPDRLREHQRAFEKSGGLHAAGLLRWSGSDPGDGKDKQGELLCVREDVGRHNAVDKVIGWAIREGRLPLSDTMLLVSGRASFELTQKAVLAGIPLLVAVSAPSSLAVDLAERTGLTLIGFNRGTSLNIYTHPGRVEQGQTT